MSIALKRQKLVLPIVKLLILSVIEKRGVALRMDIKAEVEKVLRKLSAEISSLDSYLAQLLKERLIDRIDEATYVLTKEGKSYLKEHKERLKVLSETVLGEEHHHAHRREDRPIAVVRHHKELILITPIPVLTPHALRLTLEHCLRQLLSTVRATSRAKITASS